MTTLTLPPTAALLADEHSVLLWQTAAYADDVTEAAGANRPLTPAYEAMLEFLHYRLLPYLRDEERQLSPSRLRDAHMTRLLLTDHERLRDDVENVEGSRTRRLMSLATEVLVGRLDRHVSREESWVTGPASSGAVSADGWAAPLLLVDEIDLDALSVENRDSAVLHRLTQMRHGDVVRLRARYDLHTLWRLQHRVSPNSHVWAYEQEGPEWVVRITRRALDLDWA